MLYRTIFQTKYHCYDHYFLFFSCTFHSVGTAAGEQKFNSLWCEIFDTFLLSFPQNKRKMYSFFSFSIWSSKSGFKAGVIMASICLPSCDGRSVLISATLRFKPNELAEDWLCEHQRSYQRSLNEALCILQTYTLLRKYTQFCLFMM